MPLERTVHLQLQNRVLCDDSLECFIDLGSLLCVEYGAVFGEQGREKVAVCFSGSGRSRSASVAENEKKAEESG
jgi:hypothetical protein